MVTTLQAGETDGLRKIFAPHATYVTRNYDDPEAHFLVLDGIDAIVDFHRSLLGAAPTISLSVMSIVSTEWYLFAEHRWLFKDKNGVLLDERRTAGIYVTDGAGSIETFLGYGKE